MVRGRLARFRSCFKQFPEKAILNLKVDRRGGTGIDIVLGTLEGSIDANTLPTFRATVENYLTEEPAYLVLDSSELRYVNSSGMGILIKLATEFNRAGGQFSMVGVPQKIMNLFKMLGILDVLRTYDDTPSAVKDIEERFGKGAAPPPKAEDRRFPLFIRCIGCSRRIEIPAAGYFSCPRCATYFSVKKEGKIRGYRIDKPVHAEVTCPASPEMAQGIRSLATGLATLKGFSPDNLDRIHQFLDETATILSIGGKKGAEVFVIYLVADTNEFRAAIKVAENLFDRNRSPEIGENLQVIRSLVDSMEIVTLPMGGQILKLVKRLDEEESPTD
jgi:anti-anti-sigma factor